MIIVDASVAVKWFLPEKGSEAAAALFAVENETIGGPDTLAVEVCATFVRGANMVKANRSEALSNIQRFGAMVVEGEVVLVRSSEAQLRAAAKIAIDIGHPFKDCIYLALAMELECPLITADARFANKAKDVWDQVQLLPG